MRYLVMGAGALGSVFGGLLKHLGKPVAFLGRGPHFQHLITRGLLLDGIWGEYRLGPLQTPEAEPGLFDVILLCVKSFDTRTACHLVRDLLAPDGLVVSVQNGLNNLEVITAEFGESRTIGARVIFGAQVPEPGRVTVTVYAEPVLLGAISPETLLVKLAALAADLSQAGIPARVVPDILTHLWGKVLYNCALNPLGAILEVPYGGLADHPETREIMRRIIEEIFEVAESLGVPLGHPDAAGYFHHFLTNLVPPTAAHRPSMWQDLKAGRRTEIEALNGAISNYGRELGIATPYNDTLAGLVRFLEKKQLRGGPGDGKSPSLPSNSPPNPL